MAVERFLNDRRNSVNARRLARFINRQWAPEMGGMPSQAIYERVLAEHRRRLWAFWNHKREKQQRYRVALHKDQERDRNLIAAGEFHRRKTELMRRAEDAFQDFLQLETWLQQFGLRPARTHRAMLRQLAGVHINLFDLLENRFIVHPSRYSVPFGCCLSLLG